MSLNWILSQLIAEWIFQTFRGWISRYLHLSTYLHTSSIPATVWSFLKRLFWLINDKAADVYLLLLLFSYYTNEITLPLNAIITSILKRYLLVLPILRPLPPFLSTSTIVPPHSTTWSSIVLNISTWFWVNILCMTENIVSPSASLMWWKWSGFNWPWSGEIELGPPQTTLPLTITWSHGGEEVSPAELMWREVYFCDSN